MLTHGIGSTPPPPPRFHLVRVAIERLMMVVKTFPFGEGIDREVGDGSDDVSIW